jgi:hypothetical protein
MQQMNKVMDPQKTMKVLQDFEKESMKMEMTEDMSKLMKGNIFRCRHGFLLLLLVIWCGVGDNNECSSYMYTFLRRFRFVSSVVRHATIRPSGYCCGEIIC